jgi:hypothetical protein
MFYLFEFCLKNMWNCSLTQTNIFVSFGGTLFQQVIGIPMGTNCAPLLANLFLYSYESEFLQKLVKDKKIHDTGPCIANQLRDVNTICRRSWYIWKIYDFKIEVVPFIINFSTELTTAVKFEV